VEDQAAAQLLYQEAVVDKEDLLLREVDDGGDSGSVLQPLQKVANLQRLRGSNGTSRAPI